ncbi:MAG TPA: zinc finger domain-containing protein [Candidatus Nanoarchaeia archaeon]|nr:zinc finger domain-containing protein [Candidatus Nanoarchaeia archaeon]
MEEKICTSCKKRVTNDQGSVAFNCPKCGKLKIIRCSTCRKNANHYTCANCGFQGPN